MDKVWTFKFGVEHEGSKPDEFLVGSVRAVAGAAAHCELRLRDAAAAPEQILFEAREGGVFARVLAAAPSVFLDGAPFTEGRILPQSRLMVERTRIWVELVETDFGTLPKQQRKAEPRSIAIYALGCVGFPVGFYMIANGPVSDVSVDTPSEPPGLFSEALPQCPRTLAPEARATSENELLLAESKRERSPFHPQDGVAAVAHYELSASCSKLAGDDAYYRSAKQKSESLKRKLNAEFHVHRARLDYALATEQYDRARGEVRILNAFVAANPGEYGARLSQLDRKLELRRAAMKEEEP